MADTRAGLLDALLDANPVVPVVVVDDPDDAVPAGRALLAGGIRCAEVTFRTPAADRVIAAMSSVEGLTVGAGTVLDADQARLAIDCGARFLVSPGFSDPVADVSEASGVPFLPGGATPTDVIRILERGLSTVKFFPAEAMGGLPVLTAFAGPFPQVSFVPTGGIGPGSAAEWLAAPFVRSVGGSWMISRADVRNREWARITRLSADAVRLAAGPRAPQARNPPGRSDERRRGKAGRGGPDGRFAGLGRRERPPQEPGRPGGRRGEPAPGGGMRL